MRLRPSDEIVNRLVFEAHEIGPKGPLTASAHVLNSALNLVLFLPLLVLTPVCTFVLAILVSISFGTLLMLFSAIWLPFLGILLGSSWLWVNIPILRPILLLPGVVIAVVTDAYVCLIPDMGEKYQKLVKLAICDNWPSSYIIWQLSLKEGQTE